MVARVRTNARQVNRRIQRYADNAEKTALRRAFRRAGPLLVERAQALAPIDEGDLRDAVDFTVRRKRGETVLRLGYRHADAPHGAPVELGTPHSVAQPFLVPALDSEQDEVLDLVVAELNRVGRQVGRGT